ncbi:MAG: dockerin type I repeat-containing protein, partial [Oscillospiraceae bacterium]|nr:dockerin type I repeat-containing protein [Oscillospiraceae bacterium]
KVPDTYYVDIAWDGYNIANSGKKYQFIVGLYYGDKWDPKNDWSYEELKIFKEDDAFFGNGNEVRNDRICVYDDGVLVGGTEPDGTVAEIPSAEPSPKPTKKTSPSPKPTATATAKTTATPTVKPTATATAKATETPAATPTAKPTADPVKSADPTANNDGYGEATFAVTLGDVNLDGKIDVTDLSVLSLSLVDKKELKGDAAKNADVDRDGKVALTDLATIRQYISKKIIKF